MTFYRKDRVLCQYFQSKLQLVDHTLGLDYKYLFFFKLMFKRLDISVIGAVQDVTGSGSEQPDPIQNTLNRELG